MTIQKNTLRATAVVATALVGLLGVLHIAEAAGTAHNIGTTGKVSLNNTPGDEAGEDSVVRGFAGLDVTAGRGTLSVASSGGGDTAIRAHLFNSNGPQLALRLIGYDVNQEKVPACFFVSTARGADRPLAGPLVVDACDNVKFLTVKVFDGTNLPGTSDAVEPRFLDQVPIHTSTFVGP